MGESEITAIVEGLANYQPFYKSIEFWISIAVGFASLVFSFLAFREAKAAKSAAYEAGRTVKIQTITIELTEIAQKLDKLDFELEFSEARDLLNEVSRRLRRLIAPFQDQDDLSEVCTLLKSALDEAKYALEEVRPGGEDNHIADNGVYFATQGHFSNINNIVAEILGLFEKRTIEVTGQ
ncbi:MAG: hypothetical protein ACX933_16520 [Marinobacter adhaerens]